MKDILIAAEYSGICRDAFCKLGFNAVSCDLLPSEGDPNNKHIQGDLMEIIDQPWDMIIAFPPCTHLSLSGTKFWAEKVADGRQQAAIEFVERIWNAKQCKHICIENPVGALSTRSQLKDLKEGEYKQIFQPYEFGERAAKRTCLWLKGLPKLVIDPRASIDPETIPYKELNRLWLMGPSPTRAKERARFWPKVAAQMAAQWGAKQLAPV